MTFVTSTSNHTFYTITLAPSLTWDHKVDMGKTIERLRRIIGADAVFSVVQEKHHADHS